MSCSTCTWLCLLVATLLLQPAAAAHGAGRTLLEQQPQQQQQQRVRPPTLEESFASLSSLYAACEGPAAGLVLAVAADDTKPHRVCPLLRSWSLHSPSTRMVLFTDKRAIHASVMGSPSSSRNVHVLLVTTRPQDHGTKWHQWRFFMYHLFLEACHARRGGSLPPVMVTDSRDTLAVGDVWAHPMVARAVKEGGVVFSIEGNPGEGGVARDMLNRESGFMMEGLHTCFDGVLDDQEWQLVLDSKFSCSGVTLGSGDAMLYYARAMVHFLLHNTTAACWGQHGGDQHVHTWLLLAKLAALDGRAKAIARSAWWGVDAFPFTPLAPSNGFGPIYTCGLGLPIHMDMFGVVTVQRGNWSVMGGGGGEGSFVYMHQYDRDDAVNKEVAVLWPCAYTPTNVIASLSARAKRTKALHLVLSVLGVFSVAVLASALCIVQVRSSLFAGASRHAARR